MAKRAPFPLPDQPGIMVTSFDLEVGVSLRAADLGEAGCTTRIEWWVVNEADRPNSARLEAAVRAFFAALYLPEQDTGT